MFHFVNCKRLRLTFPSTQIDTAHSVPLNASLSESNAAATTRRARQLFFAFVADDETLSKAREPSTRLALLKLLVLHLRFVWWSLDVGRQS